MQTLREQLDSKFKNSIKEANESANWYTRYKDKKKRYSKFIRLSSIILVGLGGIFPLISNSTSDQSLKFLSNWGYVSIAVAGTLIFVDRFFGFSSGWIRYIMTEMEIRKQIKDFEMKWNIENIKIDLGSLELTNEKSIELFNLINDFSRSIDELVKQETNTWATEFQANIAELQKMANAKLETMQPGYIKIVVKNMDKYKTLKIKLDGIEKQSIAGSETLIDNVSPGPHMISLIGDLLTGGNTNTQTAVVIVEATKTVTVEIAMP